MPLAPPVKVTVRRASSAPRLETPVRYGAAYASTLIAIMASGSAPGMNRNFTLALAAVTLLGLPVSLLLRRLHFAPNGPGLPRFFISLVLALMAITGIMLLVIEPLQAHIQTSIFAPDFFNRFFMRNDADDVILLILQTFSIIMVVRCLAIIGDKDTVLCTVPAFCVLVLLIVVERSVGLVFFFVLWALTAAVLFALDQRQDVARRACAVVPSVVPGQGITLSTRTLGGVLVLSLVCAVVLSLTLTSRLENRSEAEAWIAQMAGRLTKFATALPDVSVNAGPERQIDFTGGPLLPTRTALWRIFATDMATGKSLHPTYWRMFTLTNYSGTSWSQSADKGVKVPLTRVGDVGFIGRLPRRVLAEEFSNPHRIIRGKGYAVGQVLQRFQFGRPVQKVRQRTVALRDNTGFVPMLPQPEYFDISGQRPDNVRVYANGSVDMGFVGGNQNVKIICYVPPGGAFGIEGRRPPSVVAQRPNPAAKIDAATRRECLQLPGALPALRNLARSVLKNSPPDASDFARAQRLAEFVERQARYTLRPPKLPAGLDATEFFLTQSRRGYCTYFAGALAVLCRTVGIPARVVSGFTAGEFDQRGFYEVRESNAHAWTEVWVPNWGWATLDATSAEVRGDNAADWWTRWAGSLGDVLENFTAWLTVHLWQIAVVSLASLVVGVLLWRQGSSLSLRRLTVGWHIRRRRSAAGHAEADEVYHRMAREMEKRFRPRPSWETPHEWLQAAGEALRLRDATRQQQITTLFVQSRYSPNGPSHNDLTAAWKALARLSWDGRRGTE